MGDGIVLVWDAASGKETHALRGNASRVASVSFSQDGKQIVSGGDDGAVAIWDVASGRKMSTLRGYGSPVTGVAFSPDGRTIVTCSRDYTVRAWDVANGHETYTANERGCPLALSPDGKRLVSGGDDGTLRVRDVAGGTETLAFKAHDGPVRSVVFSPDGRRVASTGGVKLVLKAWDATRGRESPNPQSHVPAISAVIFLRRPKADIPGL